MTDPQTAANPDQTATPGSTPAAAAPSQPAGNAPAAAPSPAAPGQPPAADQQKPAAEAAAPAAQSWRDMLPEDLRPRMEKFADVASLAKSYAELESWRGKSYSVPGADAPDEEWGKVYDRLGRPASADKYDIKMPDGVQVDDGFMKAAKEWFHAAGLNQKQAQKVAERFAASTAEQATEAQRTAARTVEQEVDKLKREWGSGEFEKNIQIANRAFAQYMPQGAEDLVLADGSKLGNNPAMIRAFAAIGREIGEANLMMGDAGGETLDQVNSKIADLQKRPDYFSATVQAEVRPLFERKVRLERMARRTGR